MTTKSKYKLLTEANNIQIFGTIEEYTSRICNESYDIVSNILITKSGKVFYKRYDIYFPVNSKGRISIINYLDDIILYINNANTTEYWIKLELDKLLFQKHTIEFEITIKSLKNRLKEEKRLKEYKQQTKELEKLKSDIINIAENKNILVCIGYDYIRLIKDAGTNSSHNNDFIERIFEMDANNKLINKYLIKDIEPKQNEAVTRYKTHKDLLLRAKDYITNLRRF